MKFLFLVLLVVSCSGQKTVSKKNKVTLSGCVETNSSIEQRHAILSAKRQTQALAKCFQNYLRFQDNKKQSVHVCHKLNIRKSGKVIYTKAFGLGARLENDFKMCIEQSLWVMNFKSLQLEEGLHLVFPLEFKSE